MSNDKPTIYHTDELKAGSSASDWKRAASQTDAIIETADRADPELDGIDDTWFAEAILEQPAKKHIYAAFDEDVLAFFRRGGRGYQGRMNAVLRAYMHAHSRKE